MQPTGTACKEDYFLQQTFLSTASLQDKKHGLQMGKGDAQYDN